MDDKFKIRLEDALLDMKEESYPEDKKRHLRDYELRHPDNK